MTPKKWSKVDDFAVVHGSLSLSGFSMSFRVRVLEEARRSAGWSWPTLVSSFHKSIPLAWVKPNGTLV